ncbi:MAG TPA: TetR/AcrR family transcriptional regulator [Gemmatimonadaceae bacterium]|nr:TetR/AcrR family transcriptional regulator [Gemmatimonadaceae bacterium]
MTDRPVKAARPRTRAKPRDRRRRPDERPAQILEAALDVFGEKGLAAARLDDIARRAQLAKGTIYLYFPNKDELFRAVIRSTVVAELERAESVRTVGPADQQLDAFMRGYWNFICTPTFERIHRLVMSEMPKFPDLARFYGSEVIARSHKLIGAIISDGIAQGIFRDADPLATARMIMSSFVMHGIWRTKRVILPHLGELSDEVMFEQVIDFIHAALRPDERMAQHSPAPGAQRSHS